MSLVHLGSRIWSRSDQLEFLAQRWFYLLSSTITMEADIQTIIVIGFLLGAVKRFSCGFFKRFRLEKSRVKVNIAISGIIW